MRDYLLTPPELKALLRSQVRLIPFNLAFMTFSLMHHFNVGGVR